jgi:hypothetical protein
MEELAHATRRADASDKEVRVLRARVEELKEKLARAEDVCDQDADTIRWVVLAMRHFSVTADTHSQIVDELATKLLV